MPNELRHEPCKNSLRATGLNWLYRFNDFITPRAISDEDDPHFFRRLIYLVLEEVGFSAAVF